MGPISRFKIFNLIGKKGGLASRQPWGHPLPLPSRLPEQVIFDAPRQVRGRPMADNKFKTAGAAFGSSLWTICSARKEKVKYKGVLGPHLNFKLKKKIMRAY